MLQQLAKTAANNPSAALSFQLIANNDNNMTDNKQLSAKPQQPSKH